MSADSPGDVALSGEALVAGPRGRALCLTLLWRRMTGAPTPAWSRVWDAAAAGDLSGHLDDLAECVALADPAATAADESAVLKALAWVVDMAAYWQPPPPAQAALGHPAVRELLAPVAEAVAAAPATRWWASPADPVRQRYAQFLEGHPVDPPRLTGAADALGAWRTDTLSDERRSVRERPEDPTAPYSGHWWSDPALSGLPVTTRALSGLGALRLALVEDSLGWTAARCWPVTVRDDTRIFEVHGPSSWASLVARYPLGVSGSRRHDWWRATGRAGRWLIPDYAAVAADWDAVHVSVLGYLTTAGIAVPVGGDDDGACTMLAGWDPDATWWLGDVLSLDGPPEEWHADDGKPLGWASP